MDIIDTTASDLQFTWCQLSGPEFNEAISGSQANPPWLEFPKLKYFRQCSALIIGRDTREFFIVTKPSQVPERSGMDDVLAMLEIDFLYQSTLAVGIKYVSVHPSYRRQGLAIALYRMLIEHLKAKRLRLLRSRPGLETPEQFTEAITHLLNEQSVDWFKNE